MTNAEFSQLEKIRTHFKNLENSLFEIKLKLQKRESFLFVNWHTYSQEELLNNSVFSKIDAVVGVISSNIDSWLQYNSISTEFMHNYNSMRDAFERKIDDLRNEIIKREPTFWETIKNGFMGFVRIIINKLPKIVIHYLTGGKITLMLGE